VLVPKAPLTGPVTITTVSINTADARTTTGPFHVASDRSIASKAPMRARADATLPRYGCA